MKLLVYGFILFLSLSISNADVPGENWSQPQTVKYVRQMNWNGFIGYAVGTVGFAGTTNYEWIYRTNDGGCSEERGRAILSMAMTAMATGTTMKLKGTSFQDAGFRGFVDAQLGDF